VFVRKLKIIILIRYIIPLVVLLIFATGCNDDNSEAGIENKKEQESQFQGFKIAEDTNIKFNNIIQESLSFNVISNESILNGGGVGVIDVNNVGLQDIYILLEIW
jgi:hypothetical protein